VERNTANGIISKKPKRRKGNNMPYIVIAKSTFGNIFQINKSFYSVDEANNYMLDFTDVADYDIKYVPGRTGGIKMNPEKMKARARVISRWF
jgi:hypothetical protein